jgi:ATP-dependent Clp protease ATP-binding subunit ClpA
MPLMFFIIVAVTLYQFFSAHPLTLHGIAQFLSSLAMALVHGWKWLVGIAVVLWIVILIAIVHERRVGRQKYVRGHGSWIMDVLDRLTNRQALEQRLSEAAEPTFINSDALSQKLKDKVIGQDAVCDDLAAQIRRRLALSQRGKPVGVFLFAGPPGTGKSYLAKRLAIELERKLLHFDMSQFARGSVSSTQLFGSPKGYVGSDSYGKLTAALRDVPDSVVLLDEFEKAHSDIHKNFLTAWNDGFITEASDSKQISTTRSIFVMTTNAAVESLSELATRYLNEPDELRRASVSALMEAGFAPEVLNRIDRVFVFTPLKGLDIARVSALEIEAMIHNYGLEVVAGGIAPELLFNIVRRQQKVGSATSSRDIVRTIEETIADSLIDAKKAGSRFISLAERNGAIVAVVAPDAGRAAAPARDYFDNGKG